MDERAKNNARPLCFLADGAAREFAGAFLGNALFTAFEALRPCDFLQRFVVRRFGADPATASTIFLTMVTDSMSFLAFLGLASALSGWIGIAA